MVEGRSRRVISPHRKQWALALIVLVSLAAVVRFGIVPAVARRSLASRDRARAEAILRRFPSIPQAHETDRASVPIRPDEDSDDVTGYTMNVAFRLPPEATPSNVFSYYSARLPTGWRAASNRDCPTGS